MKFRTSAATLALCCTLFLPHTSQSQSADSRPRRTTAARTFDAGGAALRTVDPRNTNSTFSLDSMVPRDGLQFYFEVRNGGLIELAQALKTLEPVMKTAGTEKRLLADDELVGFALKNLSAFSTARLALAGYGATGVAALIEAASPSDAERLKGDLARLLAARPAAKKGSNGAARASELTVALRDRAVIVGASTVIARLVESGGAFTLAQDQQFLKARTRFSDDPFFAYLEMGNLLSAGIGNASETAPYTAGMTAALNSLPQKIAMGGAMQAGRFTIRALVFDSPNQGKNLFTSILSSTRAGMPASAGFAPADTELFVAAMIDWEKLYLSVESLIGMMAGAMAKEGSKAPPMAGGLQSGDLLATMETALGFSIKNDLIPTLGNEVAFALSGTDSFLPRGGQPVSARTTRANSRTGSVRFMLMLAVRDQVKFEGLLTRLFDQFNGRASQPFARAVYRGATIKYRKDMAYTITGGFLIVGGSRIDIQRAIDARATGMSLAAAEEYRSAVGPPRPVTLQAYLSAGVTSKFFDMALADMLKTSRIPQTLQGRRAGVGLALSPDEEGLLVEVRAPADFALMALASMMQNKPSPYGTDTGVRAGPGDLARPVGKTPVMTDEDLRRRRP
ncbi:MAG: DUF3352 domain-containing protein [Blastocatellia bacterium]|nr:DUF3352 domain-containing protein [Blastocatellia bacterium]